MLDEASETHKPIQITGKRSNAILISEEDWRSIHETLYLTSISRMQINRVEGSEHSTGRYRKESLTGEYL
ncbi:type II toxin-antitoxin system Phd/YefM family antitoxin [Rhodohalobacter sp.]|uniref:type II toxin-antitoxin system Phd/YefM family antitoxin n=1 Tax=Rhodohalobacter sp. TaxID=1974210 RepID=UPI003A0FFE70